MSLGILRPARLAVIAAIALLAYFLHGGRLASLQNVLAVPHAIAQLVASAFSLLAFFGAYRGFADPLRPLGGADDDLWTRFCLAAAVYAVVLRLIYLGVPELLFAEAYYWNYAQHLDIGYLDHPRED